MPGQNFPLPNHPLEAAPAAPPVFDPLVGGGGGGGFLFDIPDEGFVSAAALLSIEVVVAEGDGDGTGIMGVGSCKA